MSMDPRVALANLVAALEEHLNAAANRRGDNDPVVDEAYEHIAESFEAYEDALWSAYAESTPLDLFDEDPEDEDADADDEDDTED